MYAPAKWLPATRPSLASEGPRSEQLQGYPRHVTAEGCQFLLASGSCAADERKVFTVSNGTSVTGTIRWILEERVGFAFDRPLDDATLTALSDEVAALTALKLVPAQAAQHG